MSSKGDLSYLVKKLKCSTENTGDEKEEKLVREGRSRWHKTEITTHVTCDSFQSELIAFISHVSM